MIFQRKIDRAFKKLHEEGDYPEENHFHKGKKQSGNQEDYDAPELEKNDFLAMVLAAMIVILPVALIVLGGIALLGYFFLMH